MKRREFTAALSACVGTGRLAPWLAGGALVAAPAARAQTPQAGRDYVVIQPPLRQLGASKIEVIEFFWYGCPHCHRFEPMLEAWVQQLPADVSFRRVPVAFRDAFVVHQRIYYALEALGRVEDLHRKVFFAIHTEKNPLNTEAAAADFVAAQGVDRAQFVEAYRSGGVETKALHARQLSDRYKIDGVPTLGVAGRYWTSGGLTGSLERSLQVADHLIDLARRG